MGISKQFFKDKLKHSQVVVSTNPNDLGEETARYRMDTNGDLYQLNADKGTEKFLFNINNGKKLQDLYDKVLCKVVNCSYTEHEPHNTHIERCSKVEFNGNTYLTRSVTLWKRTDEEVEYNFAEEQLGTDLMTEDGSDYVSEEARIIDEEFSAYPPRTWLTDMNDDELASRIQEEFYSDEEHLIYADDNDVKLIGEYVWENLAVSMDTATQIHKRMVSSGKSLAEVDKTTFDLVEDLINTYCKRNNIDEDDLRLDYNEDYFFNTMFDLENNP